VLTQLALHAIHHFHGPRVDFDAVGLAAAVSWLGIAGPGEAVLIGAGIAASRGRPDIASVILYAWGGATIGGIAGWSIGRFGGRQVVLRGRWLLAKRERALEHGERFFERFGWFAVYWVPSWVAGINRMSAARFIPANAVWALAWALVVGLGSYAIGPSVRDFADDAGVAGSILIALGAIAAVVLARRGIRRRRAAEGHGGTTD
jgi:membrane protein DedA with SNARE-associated domain